MQGQGIAIVDRIENEDETLQIREEKKQISKNELAGYLGLNQTQTNELINNGFLPQDVENNSWCPSELLSQLQDSEAFPSFELDDDSKADFGEILSSILVIEKGGVFVISSDIYPSNYDGMSDMIERYGLWKAQGLNNHIHLRDIVANPIYQIILADRIVQTWKKEICRLNSSESYVVYWNGPIDSTLCIYLKGNEDNNFLKKYDDYLKIKSVSVKNIP